MQFISYDLFSKIILHMIQMILFTLAWKRGKGSNYLFLNLYSDLIVSWEQERGDGSIWEQTLYFRGGGIMGTGAFWREHGDRRIFSKDLFSKNFIYRITQII